MVMEACGSAHYWGRQARALGHEVHLLPAHQVSKYRTGNKTDRRDAEAILEAHRCEALRPVPVKSIEEQTIGTLHRLRTGWMRTRISRLNALRGALRELGVVVPVGARWVLPAVHEAMGNGTLPPPLVDALAQLCDEVRALEQRIKGVERQLESLSADNPVVARLRSVPGIGLLSATALVARVGDARRFRSGRHVASFIGLVPKEHSSGTRRRLGAITREGDAYLRTLLIAGAHAVLAQARHQTHPDRLRRWALSVQASRGPSRAAIALANRLARIAWAVWTKEVDYQSQRPIAT